MGDFNTPLSDDKKLGGMVPNLDLSNFINSLAFMDMELLGGRFTSSNRHIGAYCIQVRLTEPLFPQLGCNLLCTDYLSFPELVRITPLFLFLSTLL